MTPHEHKPLDRNAVLLIVRDLLIAVIFGWAGAEGAVALLQHYIPPDYMQQEWYSDFQTLIEMMAGITTGGLAYAVALHFHSKRDKEN